MLYFANPKNGPVNDAIRAGELGATVTPDQGNAIPDGAVWFADNGRYSGQIGPGGIPLVGDLAPRWHGDLWFTAWLAKRRPMADRCLFVVAPDQPFDMAATLPLSVRWSTVIERMGYRPALALQDGAEDMRIPWAQFGAVFIGGTDQWKIGPAASHLIREARARGMHAHMGRVNSLRRLRQAWGMGCDSVDGGWFRRHPQRLADAQAALRDLERNGAQWLV